MSVIKSALYILDVFDYFLNNNPKSTVGATQISKETGLTRDKAQNALETLHDAGMLKNYGNGYKLSKETYNKIYKISASKLESYGRD